MSEVLNIQHLSVSYGAIAALKDVSITVQKGSITAILGANGGGKSTLLKTISGLIPPKSGRILFDGLDISKVSADKITDMGIIHVPEGRQIFGELTVLENLMIGAFTAKEGPVNKAYLRGEFLQRYSDREEVVLSRKEMIANNLLRVYEYFPVLQERKQQQAVSLSGGEQQMLAIGRALMSTPQMLILDEPSLGLAPLIVKSIFEIIADLNKTIGLTVLIVEQNALQTLQIADYAYVLQVGRIVKSDKASVLAKDTTLVEAYLGK
ncbi:ABC transporter ATP-binding protein [Candidatus Xianfuyuplasma coldseepsis]|uniref:ABC transporter ATP-binding protein n=1 Tax=Candidatus Xianfuyuplasma coldseepsis TaxID=2782163 RepID=A0A7L7KUA2_9MOLU|nr:ABC transporter ATP-binding protein [Xianfuyuplasma coldseepsis]QMS85979.1 ABC transporter ATP-binding protein [Xianfuyuplasma coldseepsis]